MLVMILQKAPMSLKGELSRWLIEPARGVFMGNPSARVRDELWQRVVSRIKGGAVIQVWAARTPQGFQYRVHGTPSRRFVDFEGIALLATEEKKQRTPPPRHQDS